MLLSNSDKFIFINFQLPKQLELPLVLTEDNLRVIFLPYNIISTAKRIFIMVYSPIKISGLDIMEVDAFILVYTYVLMNLHTQQHPCRVF